MNVPAPTLNLRLRGTLALPLLIAALAIPSAALGQDPAADQYAPARTSGADDVPTSPANDPASAVEGGSGTATGDSTAGGSAVGQTGGERAGGGSQPGAELLRADNPSGPGLGFFLWIAVGITLLWAIASATLKFRNRQSGADGSPRATGPPAAADGRDGQVA